MNRGLWIARKNHLCCLMRKVSEGHGGEPIEELRQQCKETFEAYPGEKIEEAITCYEEMVDKLKYYSERMK